MTTCAKLEERLAAYADGEEDADVQAHVATCASCASEVSALRDALRAAKATDRLPPRKDERFWTDFTRDVRVRYFEEDQRRRRTWWLGVCAAGLAATVILFAVVLPSRLPPRGKRQMEPVAERVPEPEAVPFAIPVENEEDLDAAELDAVLGELAAVEAAALLEAVEEADEELVLGEADPESTVEELEGDELERVLDALGKGV